jgi:hypothetical protein
MNASGCLSVVTHSQNPAIKGLQNPLFNIGVERIPIKQGFACGRGGNVAAAKLGESPDGWPAMSVGRTSVT